MHFAYVKNKGTDEILCASKQADHDQCLFFFACLNSISQSEIVRLQLVTFDAQAGLSLTW